MKSTLLIVAVISSLGFLVFPFQGLAQVLPPTQQLPTSDPCAGLTLDACIQLLGGRVSNFLFMAVIVLAVILILYGAFKYMADTMTGQGDKAQGREWLTLAIQMVAYAVVAWIIVRLVVFVVGKVLGGA